MKKAVINNIKAQINRGESVVDIINYLFTCDYEATEIMKVLVHKFGCQEQLLRDVFKVNFDIEFSPFISVV